MASGKNKSSVPEIYKTEFLSKGIACDARLYLPRGKDKPPVVIMAHGFGAEMSFRLPAFAEKFVEKGLAVFMFDYRTFGKSGGTPRNLVNPWRHCNDWKAAISHVRSLDSVNNEKIALWGSSFSGGHVVVTAASDTGISAIVSQVPFMDGIAAVAVLGIKNIIKGTLAGLRDIFRMITFRKPFYVPIVAEPDTFAAMNRPDSMPGYLSIVPEDSTWKNRCPARIALIIGLYRPIMKARKVSCPALVIEGIRDNLFRAGSVARAAGKMKQAELVSLSCGHFDPYTGPLFEKVSAIESEFLAGNLL